MTTTAAALDTYLHTVPRALSLALCEQIVETCRPRAEWHSPPYREINGQPEDGGQLRACPITDLGWLHGAEAVLYEAFHATNAWTGWDIPLDIARFGVSGYEAGDWMTEHVDAEERGAPPWDLPHRGISCSVQLSDPDSYEGGDLRVRDGAGAWRVAPRDQGTAILFGSSLPHEVTPVTYGERWVLLGWGYCNHDERGIR